MIPQRQQFLNHDKPEFIEDFIYTPPYEMMDRALQINQEGYDNAINMASLYGNIPVDFIAESPEARAEAQRLIDFYSQAGDDISNTMTQDPMNWRKHSSGLNNLRNQLSKDFQTGRLSELRQSRENYDNVMKHLDSIDPIIRQAAKDKLLNEYNQGVESGKLFENRTFLDRRNLNEEFAASLINRLGGSTDEFTRDLVGKMQTSLADGTLVSALPGYIRSLSEVSSTNAREVELALQAMMSEPGVKAYLNQMQELGLEDPEETLQSLLYRGESLVSTANKLSDRISEDTKVTHDLDRFQRDKFHRDQMYRDMTTPEERGGNFEESLTDYDNKETLEWMVNDVLTDPDIIGMLSLEDIDKLNALQDAPLQDQVYAIIDIMDRTLGNYAIDDGATEHLNRKLNSMVSWVEEVENSTAASWTGHPEYDTNPLLIDKLRKQFNQSFQNSTEVELKFYLPTDGATYVAKSGDLRNLSKQASSIGVPGTEIRTIIQDKDGNEQEVNTGYYREYLPNIGSVGEDPTTGELVETTRENQSSLRAVILKPDPTQEAIPNSNSFVKNEQTGSVTPTAGHGILRVERIGYSTNKEGTFVKGATPTGGTARTNFQTRGANSLGVGYSKSLRNHK